MVKEVVATQFGHCSLRSVRIPHMGVVGVYLEQFHFIDLRFHFVGANLTFHEDESRCSWHKGRIIERNYKSARMVFH